MAKPNEKLSAAMKELLQVEKDGIVQTSSLTRTIRERLIKAGFLAEITKGWYHQTNPAQPPGSTWWYGSFFAFAKQYLTSRFGSQYCLTAEASLVLHSGSTSVPSQLSAMSPSGNNLPLHLPLGTSLFVYQDSLNFPAETSELLGLKLMRLPEALVRVSESFFK